MKYFIDFEATQFSSEIISIGCVDEGGRKFYTLVKPQRPGRLTSFITELTGIKREDLAAAPTADEAFSAFYDWLDKTQTVEFLCYGNCDRHFAECTLRNISSFTAQCTLGLIISTLRDYSLELAKHYGIWQPVALIKAYEHYTGGHVEQTHNSLDDAVCLKYVYEHASVEVIDECPFPEYRINELKEKSARIANLGYTELKRGRVHAVKVSNGKEFAFSSYARAADWLLAAKKTSEPDDGGKSKSNICNRIIKATKSDQPYFGYIWFVDSKSNAEETAVEDAQEEQETVNI